MFACLKCCWFLKTFILKEEKNSLLLLSLVKRFSASSILDFFLQKLSNIKHKDFRAASVLNVWHMCYPHWILKQDGLEQGCHSEPNSIRDGLRKLHFLRCFWLTALHIRGVTFSIAIFWSKKRGIRTNICQYWSIFFKSKKN